MSKIRRNISRRKLEALLARVDHEAFFLMCWAIHAAQNGRAAAASKYFQFPPEAATRDWNSTPAIHPWALETLLNELLANANLTGQHWPHQPCRNFNDFALFYNRLYDLEGLDHQLIHQANRGLREMHRISQRQLEWQRGFISLPQLYRAAFLYGGPLSRTYFEKSMGLSLENFMLGCFAIYTHALYSPFISVNNGLAEVGLPQHILQNVVDVIAKSHDRARDTALDLRSDDSHVSYKKSLFRTHPCIVFGKNIYVPLPELVGLRCSSGIFYDVIRGPKYVRDEIAKQFEIYVQQLLAAYLAPKRVVTSYKYGSKGKTADTPDVLLYESGKLSFIFECKSTRLSHAARFAEEPLTNESRGYDELAHGIFQIWRFVSHVRRGIVPSEKCHPNLRGMVITLDSWLSIAPAIIEELFAKAKIEAGTDTGIIDEDHIPITFCLIDDLESVLSYTTPAEFLETARVATDLEYRGWLLPNVRRRLLPKRRQQRPYPFKQKIRDVLPWWARLSERSQSEAN